MSLKKILGLAGGVIGSMFGLPPALTAGIGTLLGGGSMKDAILSGVIGSQTGQTGQGIQSLIGQGTTKKAAQEGILQTLGEKLSTPKGLITAAMLASAFEKPKLVSKAPPDPKRLESSPDYEPVKFELFPDMAGGYTTDPNRLGIMSAAKGGFIQGPGTGRSDSIKSMIYQNGKPVQEARLSDGEFVFTANAVKGAGNGNKAKGAAKMYEMMNAFERMA